MLIIRDGWEKLIRKDMHSESIVWTVHLELVRSVLESVVRGLTITLKSVKTECLPTFPNYTAKNASEQSRWGYCQLRHG